MFDVVIYMFINYKFESWTVKTMIESSSFGIGIDQGEFLKIIEILQSFQWIQNGIRSDLHPGGSRLGCLHS